MRITGIDHVVLYVADPVEAAAFYGDVLDGEVLPYGDGWRAVQLGETRINFRPDDADAYLVAEAPTAGAGDVCLVTDDAIDDVADRLDDRGVEVVEGPVERQGARGAMTSVYFYDPEGNLVEVAEYE